MTSDTIKMFGILILTITCLFGQTTSLYPTSVRESQICVPPRRCLPNSQCRNGEVNDFTLDLRKRSQPEYSYDHDRLLWVLLTSSNTVVLQNGVEAHVCDHYERCCGDIIQNNNIHCGNRRQPIVSNMRTNKREQLSNSLEFPWMVALLGQSANDIKTKLICAGSLIHPRVVLTAAHCVNIRTIQNITLRAGESSTNDRAADFQIRNAIEIVQHEDYYNLTGFNDVALIVTEFPFNLNDNVQTICLPTQQMIPKSEPECYSAGWAINNGLSHFDIITTKLHVLPSAICQMQLQQTRLGQHFRLDSSFKCAGGTRGHDTCTGDGGGPLMCPMSDDHKRFYQTGIVAWGIECDSEKVPGVYVDVAVFRTWIDRKMEERHFGTQTYTK